MNYHVNYSQTEPNEGYIMNSGIYDFNPKELEYSTSSGIYDYSSVNSNKNISFNNNYNNFNNNSNSFNYMNNNKNYYQNNNMISSNQNFNQNNNNNSRQFVSRNTGEVYSNGEHIKLVTGYQARNNKRVVVLGSTEICSDKFYFLSMGEDNKSMLDSPNAVFCKDILNWNFQRTGVLKFTNVKHNNNEGKTLETYRIKDYLEYYIDILEYDYVTDTWKNYEADDIQLSFIMMNPYYINQMKKLYGKPTYYVKFRAPEKHGVFKFIVDYHRTGYSYIFSSTKVPLRPFYHNEFPRFIPCAYPYYVSVFVILGAFILFSVLFLYGKEKERRKKNE